MQGPITTAFDRAIKVKKLKWEDLTKQVRDTHLDLAAFLEIVCKLLVCNSFRLRKVPRMKALVRADVPAP